jgi:hypothetical protein
MNMFWPDTHLGPSSPRRRAIYLALGAVAMLAGSWAVATEAGATIAILAGLFGWLACRMLRPEAPAAAPLADAAPGGELAPVGVPLEPGAMAVLRHDVRGMLSPALMVADRLVAHEDPVVARAGDVIARTVQRVTDRLDETKT